MAASDYVPIFFKNRLHLEGRPQMSTRPNNCSALSKFCDLKSAGTEQNRMNNIRSNPPTSAAI